MLRGQKLAACVKQNYKATIQIDHLNRSPSSIQTKLNPDFSKTLETQTPNPSKAYQYEMKKILFEDLNEGIRERTNSLKTLKMKQQAEKKDYRERINGVLGQLQKNSMKYSVVLQSRMNRQQERKKLFIDEDRLKNSKISQFIDKREDKDIFNHQSDLYQKYQKQEYLNSLYTLEKQKEAKMQEIIKSQMTKQEEERNRLIFEWDMQNQNLREKQERRERQVRYGTELSSMVKEKKVRDSLDKKVEECTISRHNPITNPIQYHVDNPYLLKRMQERQRF